MITAAAGFHITLYSVPPMRLQRRPSAAPRCSRGRSWEARTLEIAEPIHPASSPPRYCVGAAGGGPAVPNQPAAQARTSSTTITATTARTTRACPSGSSSAPPIAAARRVHLGRAAGRRARGCAASLEDAPPRRSLQVGGVRAVEQGRRPTPSVYLRPDDLELGALIGAGGRAQVRDAHPGWTGPRTARLPPGPSPARAGAARAT